MWDPVDEAVDPADWRATGRRLTRDRPASPALPFVGGVVGVLGAEAGGPWGPFGVHPAASSLGEPRVLLRRHEGAACFDHSTRTWHLTGPTGFQADAADALHEAGERPLPAPPRPGVVQARTVPREAFLAAVGAALEDIAAGEVYQLNLTRAVHVDGVDGAWPVWRRLGGGGRGARAAYLSLGPGAAVLSDSPEIGLDADGDALRVLPIKGTAARHADPALDTGLAAALLASDKETAELTMIVDLTRNDLGRVAVPGSVEVGPRHLLTLPNVHHAVQSVRARLRPGQDVWDALAAVFPPGSVTGCPKTRATARIADLEHGPRGPYCGLVGFSADHGVSRWSVAIRSAVVVGRRARYHVGAGIVADSVPEREWEETEAKGLRLAAAMGLAAEGATASGAGGRPAAARAAHSSSR